MEKLLERVPQRRGENMLVKIKNPERYKLLLPIMGLPKFFGYIGHLFVNLYV